MSETLEEVSGTVHQCQLAPELLGQTAEQGVHASGAAPMRDWAALHRLRLACKLTVSPPPTGSVPPGTAGNTPTMVGRSRLHLFGPPVG